MVTRLRRAQWNEASEWKSTPSEPLAAAALRSVQYSFVVSSGSTALPKGVWRQAAESAGHCSVGALPSFRSQSTNSAEASNLPTRMHASATEEK